MKRSGIHSLTEESSDPYLVGIQRESDAARAPYGDADNRRAVGLKPGTYADLLNGLS